jgi:hypothetical protein
MPRKLKAEKSLEAIRQRWVSNDVAMKALEAPIRPSPNLSEANSVALENALLSAGILKNQSRVKKDLEKALSQALAYSKDPFLSYNQKKLTRQSFGTDRPSGPHQKDAICLLLSAAIFRAWRQYFDQEPRISRPLTSKKPRAVRSACVSFARDIFKIAKISKVEDRLLAYRKYERSIGLHSSLSKKQANKKKAVKK